MNSARPSCILLHSLHNASAHAAAAAASLAEKKMTQVQLKRAVDKMLREAKEEEEEDEYEPPAAGEASCSKGVRKK